MVNSWASLDREMGWRASPQLLPSPGVAIVTVVAFIGGSDVSDGSGVTRCEAYKLHTIALTPFPLQPCNSATHVSKEDCASTFAIDLFNAPVRSSGKMKEETGEKEREREREKGKGREFFVTRKSR